MNKQPTIPDHWDTGRNITQFSNAQTEFDLWHGAALISPDWRGDEFTLADFEAYIKGLAHAAANPYPKGRW